jgi:hypothetical protein
LPFVFHFLPSRNKMENYEPVLIPKKYMPASPGILRMKYKMPRLSAPNSGGVYHGTISAPAIGIIKSFEVPIQCFKCDRYLHKAVRKLTYNMCLKCGKEAEAENQRQPDFTS